MIMCNGKLGDYVQPVPLRQTVHRKAGRVRPRPALQPWQPCTRLTSNNPSDSITLRGAMMDEPDEGVHRIKGRGRESKRQHLLV